MKVRPPAVAGIYYPESKKELKKHMDELVKGKAISMSLPKALLVPHRSITTEGALAAQGYKLLKRHKETITKVIILAPAHHYPLVGCAVSSHDALETPLGEIPIDKPLRQRLLNSAIVVTNDLPHVMEHSIELQLPFLQTCLKSFSIIPIAVGKVSVRDMLAMFRMIPEQQSVLFVFSAELSGCFDKDTDMAPIESITNDILTQQPILNRQGVCGGSLLNAMISWSELCGWRPNFLACNGVSIETASSVVFAFNPPKKSADE